MSPHHIRLNPIVERLAGLRESGLPGEFNAELTRLERRIGSVRAGGAGYVTLASWLGFFVLLPPAIASLLMGLPYLAALCGLSWGGCCFRIGRGLPTKKGHPNG